MNNDMYNINYGFKYYHHVHFYNIKILFGVLCIQTFVSKNKLVDSNTKRAPEEKLVLRIIDIKNDDSTHKIHM